MTYDYQPCDACGRGGRTLSHPHADLGRVACECGATLTQDWTHKLAHIADTFRISTWFHNTASDFLPPEVVGASAASEERREFVRDTWAPETPTAERTVYRYGPKADPAGRAKGAAR